MRCLIVDDEPLAIRVLETHLATLPGVEVVAVCSSAIAAREALRRHPVDVVFLDIQMPHLTGLDLIRVLHRPPPIILTTAHREYALEGYELDVVDYLLKPISLPRLMQALEKARRRAGGTEPPTQGPPAEPARLNVRADRQVVSLPIDAIRYVESVSDYVRIHTTERVVISKQRLRVLAEELAPHGFLRIHRSYLVARQHLTAFTAESVRLGDTTLPIGRTYKAAVLDRLGYEASL